MGKKNYQDKLGDELVKKSEEARKLKKIGGKAAVLTALLTGRSKIDLVRKEVLKRLPVVYMYLCEKKEFYKNKSTGNIINLDKEIQKCDKYLDEAKKEMTLEKSMEILDWSHKIDEKYGFESF